MFKVDGHAYSHQQAKILITSTTPHHAWHFSSTYLDTVQGSNVIACTHYSTDSGQYLYKQ